MEASNEKERLMKKKTDSSKGDAASSVEEVDSFVGGGLMQGLQKLWDTDRRTKLCGLVVEKKDDFKRDDLLTILPDKVLPIWQSFGHDLK